MTFRKLAISQWDASLWKVFLEFNVVKKWASIHLGWIFYAYEKEILISEIQII